MKHFTEHIIELLVLNDPTVEAERAACQRHLAECAGCADLYKEIAHYYAALSAPAKSLTAGDGLREEIIVRPDYAPQKLPVSLPVKFFRLAKRHPVASAATGVAFFAGMFAMAVMTGTFRTSEPASVVTNSARERLEVFDKDGRELWTAQLTPGLVSDAIDQRNHVVNSFVAEYQKYGKMAVFTAFPGLEGENKQNAVLHAYDRSKKELLRRELGGPFAYKGIEYEKRWTIRGVLYDDFGNSGKKEFIVGMAHYHSPYAVLRLDEDGNEIGSYWKFGHCWGIEAIDWDRDGVKEIFLPGLDDESGLATLTVLDPRSLIGRQECTLNRGYGFAPSTAEWMIITFPMTDVDSTIALPKPRILFKAFDTVDKIGFTYLPNKSDYNLDYIFNRRMEVIGVEFNDQFRRLYEKLRSEGKVRGNVDDAYAKRLVAGVRVKRGGELAGK